MRRTIFVFGSNTEGKHGKGAALHAVKYFWANYGSPEGIQGNSYAIVTKDLTGGKRSIPLKEIADQITKLHKYTVDNPTKDFIVSPIGCGLAGYDISEIKSLFTVHNWPENVYFSSKFL